LLIFSISCHKKTEKINPRVEDITESVYASGIVKSSNQYEVFSPVNGLIKSIFVKENDFVKKGDPLLQIDAETAQLNKQNAELAFNYGSLNANKGKLLEAEANINFIKAKMNNDSSLLARQQNLWNQGIGTRNELEQRELAYKNDQASYHASMYHYYDLKRQINFTASQSKNNFQISKSITHDYTIKSQVEGRIYSIAKKDNEMVTTQSPVAVVGSEDFILELQIDQYDIEKIKAGQLILLNMDSYKDEAFEAKVSRILPYMNERTRSFTIEAIFITKPPTLYPNLTVEANIMIQTKQNAITIPRDYLLNDSFVVLAGNKKRRIITGLKDYRKVEVLKGLTIQEQIIKAE
jgi:multidrug efflux pump subunit AcrA (membrane-fusion protein)